MAITPGWGSQWDTLSTAINEYFGGGIASQQYQDVVNMLNTGQYTPSEMDAILKQIPEFNTTYNASGELVQVTYRAKATTSSAAGNIAQSINSNAANATTSNFSTVQTITKNPTTGTATISDDVVKYKAGSPTVTKTVGSSAIAAILAAGVGITAGKQLDATLYSLFPDFFDNITPYANFNPESWKTITLEESGVFPTMFNMIFGLDPETGDPQPYITEDTFAYFIGAMTQRGFFDPNQTTTDYDTQTLGYTLQYSNYPNPMITTNAPIYHFFRNGVTEYTFEYTVKSSESSVYPIAAYFDSTTSTLLYISDKPFTVNRHMNVLQWQPPGPYPTDQTLIPDHYTADSNTPEYYVLTCDQALNSEPFPALERYAAWNPTISNIVSCSNGNPLIADIARILYGNSQKTTTGLPGVKNQTGATVFDPTNIRNTNNIQDIITELKSQYPDLWDERIETSTDGDTTTVYIPIGFPTGGTGSKPTTEGATQTMPAPGIKDNADNATDELIKTIIEMIQKPGTGTGMDSDTKTPVAPSEPGGNTGTGSTPVVVLPTGSAEALYSIYNPSQAQLNSFGAWLWSTDFVDQLLKIFNDPMQAIIGLHKVFVTPPVSGSGPIKVGYLSSGVSANLVSNQYTSVDCGSVNLKEYFNNTLDYTHTDIYAYLPFIGIVPLNVSDVMRATISIKYKVDVLTGACLAMIEVNRDMNAGGVLYTYSGNCAVQYPLSSGSYMGILSGALGIAASVAGTIATGGAALPLALGVGASALTSMKSHIEHSGSLSGNAGAMGIKKPYLIIRRPQTKIAPGYEQFAGSNNNDTINIGQCVGFTRIKYCHLENIPATSQELTEIETYLKEGIII